MEKLKYKSFSFKLNDSTMQLLKELKLARGKSWNLFIYEIALDHANANKSFYRNIVFAKKYKKYKKKYCERCNCKETVKRVGQYNKSNLIVHHKDGDISNNEEDNLQTLCGTCHSKEYPK